MGIVGTVEVRDGAGHESEQNSPLALNVNGCKLDPRSTLLFTVRLNLTAVSLRVRRQYDVAMGKLFEQIRSAVANDQFFVAWHADERCEERGITACGVSEMKERREKRKRWVRRGRYAVEVEVDVVYPAGDPSEPCLEPATVRWLDEVARRAEKGDVAYLKSVGEVFRAVATRTK